MTIPNDDNRPDQPAADGTVPGADAAGSVPPAAPQPPVAPSSDFPQAPPAPPAPPAGAEAPAFAAYAAAPAAPVVSSTTPPSSINIAFWLYIGAAVLSVISGIITVVVVSSSRQSTIDSLQNGSLKNTNTNGLTVQQIADTSIALGTTLAIITLIFWALVFVLFAFFVRRGANWARIVLTVLTVLSLINLPWGFGAGALQVVLAVVATVLIWLKPASAYFAAVKASKAPRA